MIAERKRLSVGVKKVLPESALKIIRSRWYYYGLLGATYEAVRRRYNVARAQCVFARGRHELLKSGAPHARRLVIFLVPGKEFISGGILSIFNLYRFSREMGAIHGAHVVMCHYPCEARGASRYVMFENDVTIYPFEMVMATSRTASDVLVHVPEYAAEQIVNCLGWKTLRHHRVQRNIRVNILNQNALMMPRPEFLARLRELIPDLTCTAAFPRFVTPEQRQYWNVPLHLLPAWIRHDEGYTTPYEMKRNLMIVSPDSHPQRETVLRFLGETFPEMEIRVIWNVRFDEYLKLEKLAKWSLTFGEGLDGYFGGVILRGGVGFAVFNETFFTEEYRDLQTVYPDYPTLLGRIADDIRSLDNRDAMAAYSAKVRALFAESWGPQKTRAALAAFYRGEYSLP
jgi:hypothetical protein